jgi:hypothetical protein
MRTAISKIFIADDLGTTPARVNRRTGEMYISRKMWNVLDPDKRLFILLHEAGHATLNTRSELDADKFAFNAYAELGKPLSESVKALTRVLHFENPQHYDRVAQQIRRAFRYDYFVNGNKKIDLKKMENVLSAAYNGSFEGDLSDFNFKKTMAKIFIPKKARRTIEAGQQARKEEAKPAPGKTTKDTPADPQGSPREAVATDQAGNPTVPAAANKNKWMIYAGAGLVVVILVVFLILKNKR